MSFQSKYKSRWTGPQIDDSIGKVQTSSATPTPGGIAIYDSNGNLKTSKPVADNDTVRLEDVTNPNLLINGDFQVNQRNFATGTSGYTVDMWILGSNGYCTATLNQGNTITLTNNTANQDTAYFIQKVSNTNKLIGKTLTMSFCDGDDIVHSATGTIGSGTGQNYISMTIGPSNNITGWFRLYMTGSNILEATFHLRRSKTIVVKWAKLELGSVATAFSPKPYEEELAACQMPKDNNAISTTYSNPNLLINGDFRVNQRGQANYTNRLDYTVDRWLLRQDGITLTPNANGGISVVKDTANVNIWQILEMPLSTLAGKTITVSGKCNGTVFSATGTVPSAKTSSTQTVCQVHATNNWLGFKVSTTTDTNFDMYVEIAAQGNFSYEWVKLEIGSVATPYSPRPYAEELQMCQRYYQRFNTGDNYSEYALGFLASKTNAMFQFPLTQTLRTTPTIIVSDNSDFTVRFGNQSDGTLLQIATTGIAIRNAKQNNVFLTASWTTELSVNYSVATLRSKVSTSYIAFDSEIY